MNSSKGIKNINTTPTANHNKDNNFPMFNKNYKSPSTEKLYTAIPKNLAKSKQKDLKKSPSLKIASQFEQSM